jgi:NADPH-dependent glutamate synthase beta subunit-like oxidoreductase
VVQIHVVQIQEASVSQHHVLTVLGNHALQELTDLLLTDHTQSETHQTAEQEATTEQIVQRVQTLTVLGNLAHRAPTDFLLTDHTQTETHQTAEQEATTALTALQTDRHVRTLTVRGNHALQELIAQSVQVTHVVSQLVQTLASLIVTATRSVRTAYHAIAQEMKPLLALATRTQTRRLSSRTRF